MVAIIFLALAISPAWAAKNVIIMVSDGAGYNSWLAASMYQGKVGKQVYDQPGWITISAHDLSAESFGFADRQSRSRQKYRL